MISYIPERFLPVVKGLYYTIYPEMNPDFNPPANATGVHPENDAPHSLKDKHLSDATIVPDRNTMLDRLTDAHGRVAELGVNEGDFTKQIIDRLSLDELHLVDVWNSSRYDEGKMQQVRTRFADAIDDGTVEIHRKRSEEYLEAMPTDYLSFAYIDTSHGYQQTLTELELCREVVIDDGVIAGHDFCVGNPPRRNTYGVLPAVTEFCSDYQYRLSYLTLETHGHHSFALEKIR
jgi:hypothetical protein